MKEYSKERLYKIVFEANTPAGKTFDVILLVAILISILVIMLDTVDYIQLEYGWLLYLLEWVFTVLFTAEYLLRLAITKKPLKYVFSFMGIIDLISVLPAYLALVISGSHYFMVIRSIRLIRVFRVLKLTRFIGEAAVLSDALKASRHKIAVFLIAVFSTVIIMGTLLYVVEGPVHGFTSIPKSIYWAIVTLTTVGYGDISPQTAPGQFIASIIMVIGYGIIAVPTGIVTMEMNEAQRRSQKTSFNRVCENCMAEDHKADAKYCSNCGSKLTE